MALKIPGITVRVVTDTGIIAPPAFQRYPTYIGAGDPYRRYTNQKILRGAGNTDLLPSPTTVHTIEAAGDLPGIANYSLTTDYTLNGNSIDWTGGSDTPTLGDYYYVTFTDSRPASAYTPTLYFDENLIYVDHGNRVRVDGTINDVSTAGWLGINAGAKGVIICQLDLTSAADPENPTPSELETAFIAMRDELEKIVDYKLYLVPMSSGTLNTTSAANIYFNHAVLASEPEQKQERTVFAALPIGTSAVQAVAFSQAYSHERMSVPFPFNGESGIVGDATVYDSRFYVAGLVGKLASVAIGINISDEIIPNVTVSDSFTLNECNYLVQGGVGPAKLRGDVVRNVFIGTSDTTNALTEDLGVQDVKDYTKKYWREGLWDLYRNKPITSGLIASVYGSSTSIMENLISRNIIAEYRNISISQDITEPRQLNVTGSVKPAFGVQWMDITFTFVLNFS